MYHIAKFIRTACWLSVLTCYFNFINFLLGSHSKSTYYSVGNLFECTCVCVVTNINALVGCWIVSESGRLLYTAFKHRLLRMASVHHEKFTWLIVVGVGGTETSPCLWKMLAGKTWRWWEGPQCTYKGVCYTLENF